MPRSLAVSYGVLCEQKQGVQAGTPARSGLQRARTPASARTQSPTAAPPAAVAAPLPLPHPQRAPTSRAAPPLARAPPPRRRGAGARPARPRSAGTAAARCQGVATGAPRTRATGHPRSHAERRLELGRRVPPREVLLPRRCARRSAGAASRRHGCGGLGCNQDRCRPAYAVDWCRCGSIARPRKGSCGLAWVWQHAVHETICARRRTRAAFVRCIVKLSGAQTTRHARGALTHPRCLRAQM